jgi:hypothetical protein
MRWTRFGAAARDERHLPSDSSLLYDRDEEHAVMIVQAQCIDFVNEQAIQSHAAADVELHRLRVPGERGGE